MDQEKLSEMLQENRLPGEGSCTTEEVLGITGRDAGHRNFEFEDIQVGDHLAFCISSMQRNPPASLVALHAAEAERQFMKANQYTYVSRKNKREIREDVIETLQENTPVTYNCINVTVLFMTDTEGYLLIGETSPRNVELTCLYMYELADHADIKLSILPHNIEQVTERLAIDHEPFHLAEAVTEDNDHMQARDFLMWLWKVSEFGPQPLQNEGWGIGITTGNLMFAGESNGSGADEVTLSKGVPPLAREAQSSILAGKKLNRATFQLGQDVDNVYEFSYLSDKQAFSSLKLPDSEEIEVYSSALETIDRVLSFIELIEKLYAAYATALEDDEIHNEMAEWMAERNHQNK
jgi:hypothetical protein